MSVKIDEFEIPSKEIIMKKFAKKFKLKIVKKLNIHKTEMQK